MVTLAAESEGAVALTKTLADAGKIVAIGHSAADFDQVSAAADAGLSLSTHLGNGVPQMLHKLANPIFAQLAEERLMAGFSVIGQCLHYRFGNEVVTLMVPESLQSRFGIEQIAHHITRFTLAALAGYHDAAPPEPAADPAADPFRR